jgi:hypothetical protein
LEEGELEQCLKCLEYSDDIELLLLGPTEGFGGDEEKVLLDPTRIDAYASALLVAAKDEPDGPGHLLESRVMACVDDRFCRDSHQLNCFMRRRAAAALP